MSLVWMAGALVLLSIYAPVLAEMAHIWRTDTYAVHGILVPFFSAFMFWSDRDRLRGVEKVSRPQGLFVVLLGLGLLTLGRWTGILALEGLSLVAAVAGAIWWGFGARYLREAWFPIAFLVFMVPLPRAVVDAVSRDLQVFAASFAAAIVELAGMPVYQKGVMIQLPTMTLEVAEICNGLRFMMALLVLTVAFAQVTQRTRARKVILVFSAVPLAILANGFRVAAVIVAVYYIGPRAASGIIHHSIGKVVWAMTLVPLVGLGLLLRRGTGPRSPDKVAQPAEAKGQETGRAQPAPLLTQSDEP